MSGQGFTLRHQAMGIPSREGQRRGQWPRRVRSGTGHDAAGLTEPSHPGTVLKMRAKPGKGNALLKFTNALHYAADPDGPVARA
jgi:hypothetical protein